MKAALSAHAQAALDMQRRIEQLEAQGKQLQTALEDAGHERDQFREQYSKLQDLQKKCHELLKGAEHERDHLREKHIGMAKVLGSGLGILEWRRF